MIEEFILKVNWNRLFCENGTSTQEWIGYFPISCWNSVVLNKVVFDDPKRQIDDEVSIVDGSER